METEHNKYLYVQRNEPSISQVQSFSTWSDHIAFLQIVPQTPNFKYKFSHYNHTTQTTSHKLF